eukprot:9484657-Pyramimonas_sp.AAC.1
MGPWGGSLGHRRLYPPRPPIVSCHPRWRQELLACHRARVHALGPVIRPNQGRHCAARCSLTTAAGYGARDAETVTYAR